MKTLLQMSLTGCYCVPVVLAVRFLLIKVLHSPRRYVYCLWLVVFLNLCLPFSLRAPVNFVPEWLKNPAAFLSAETESGAGSYALDEDGDAQAGDGAEADDEAQAGDDVQGSGDTEAAEDVAWAADRNTTFSTSTDVTEEKENGETQTAAGSADAIGLTVIRAHIGNLLQSSACIGGLLQIHTYIGNLMETVSRKATNAVTVILSWPGLFAAWLAGLLLVLFYQGIVTFKMYRLLRCGRRAEGKERIYIVHNLSSPCLWGLFRPVICLPEGIEETEWDYILRHERCHKKRGDHIAKWVLFLITAIHWFHPLVWLAYSFCCKDMEISCDEAVLGQAGEDVRKAYAASLLKYAARQNGYLFAPLTFGEPSLRSRVFNILHYRKRGAFVCGAALVIVLLAGAGLFLWAGNSGAVNTEESTGIEESMEAIISDDEEAEDYQITGILTGAYGVCSYDDSSVDKDFISDLLWLVPRRYDVIDGTDYMEVIAGTDSLKESWDETGSYVTYTEDFPVFIRYYMESYVAPDGVNAIDHKDIILLREGDDMVACIQRPDDESEWIFYLVTDYGDWLLKEVEFRYRISFPELFTETSDSDQGENKAEITAPQKAEVMAMREIVLDKMSEEEATTLCSLIKEANTKMESMIIYADLFSRLSDPENLYWNYFDESGEIQIGWATGDDEQTMQEIISQEGLTETEYYEKYGNKVVAENKYSAEDFTQLLEEIQASVSNEALKNDLQQIIEEAGIAAETHDVEHAEQLYYLLHDMDYFLLNYRLDTEGQYIRDKSTISRYYGVLSVYD